MAHILIADDDDLLAEIARDALVGAGHPCTRVASAEEAWESVHARRPDILLLDRDMPGMSGSALLAKLRGSALMFDLPVIMFTAMRNGEGDTRHELAGAQDIIHKPFAPDRLAERIERVLASETCTLSRDDGKTIRLVRVIDDGRRSPPA